MALREAYIGAHIIETSDNYARADAPLLTRTESQHGGLYDYEGSDRSFWERRFNDLEGAWDIGFRFYAAALSEWVARVPGLFWKPEAQRLRRIAEEKITYISDGWRAYSPQGKSEKVMGGIGTFRLPPAVDGTRLVTLTTTCNASAGVPALIFPDVWDKIGQHGLREGRLLDGEAHWQAMEDGWATRFKSTRDVARGYLVLDNPDKIQILDDLAPVQIHPFTVMEYYSGTRELFDYVYATGDTGNPDYRTLLEGFFHIYKDENDRCGRYLLAGDMVDALWDAEYNSPATLRHADPSSESQLELLEARVQERLLGEDKIEELLEALGTTSDSAEDPKRLSLDIGIPPALWFVGGSVAEVCSQFLDAVVRRNKLAELVDIFALQYPSLIG